MLLIGLCVLFLFLAVFLLFINLSLDQKKCYKNLTNKHVVVTGGSSGIGKAIAEEAARLGAHVTIIGRDASKLQTALLDVKRKSIEEHQKIQTIALDVTAPYPVIVNCLEKLEQDIAPIFMLVNSAGMCICGQFDKMKIEDIKQMIDLNYFGTAHLTKYVLPGMKQRREGIIVFVASEAAFLGIYGYSAYSAAKWAVRGLAEALFMELLGTGVQLTLAFPPDTDTPGFKNEELTKPKETKLISGTGGLKSADDVGKRMIHDALNGKSYSVFGLSGQLMSLLYCASIESPKQVMLQILSMGFLRGVMVAVMLSFYRIVRSGLKSEQVKREKQN